MRKVYLTHQEMLKFMKEKRQDSLSPNLRKYYKARQELSDYLEKDDVPEDTKTTMCAQQLQRVNKLKNQVVRREPSQVQMITHTEQTMTLESDSVTPSQQLRATDKHIIDSVPKMMQNRAKLLIQKLKDNSDVISWNDNGQLILEGSIVPNSNIIDLVNDVRDGPLFFPGGEGGIVISRRQAIFFYLRLSACKFFSSPHCADNFF